MHFLSAGIITFIIQPSHKPPEAVTNIIPILEVWKPRFRVRVKLFKSQLVIESRWVFNGSPLVPLSPNRFPDHWKRMTGIKRRIKFWKIP